MGSQHRQRGPVLNPVPEGTPPRVRSTDTLVLNSTPFGNDPKPRVRSTDNVVLNSTPVSRQTDKFESPKLPIYSKILRDLRVPFPFPKSV